MATQESSLRVGVDSREAEAGARRVEKSLDRMGQKAKQTENIFDDLAGGLIGGFGSALAGLGIGMVVAEFGRLLDAATNIDNRLRLVTNSQEELNAVYEELFQISQRTRSSLEDNAEVFNRMAMATQNMGLTYRQQLDLTEQLNQAMAISGTTAMEGAAALRQLGQALGTGKLSGDEFISVNENLPRVMEAVADKLGVTRGELKGLAKDGAITAEVIVGAMRDAAPELAKEFEQVTPTISGAFTTLRNAILNSVRDFNNATGAGAIFANMIMFLANNINVIIGAFGGLATVITARLIPALARMTIALLANPFGAAIAAAMALGAALAWLSQQTMTFGNTSATGWQAFKAAVMTARDMFGDFVGSIADGFAEYYAYLSNMVQNTWANLKTWLSSWGITVNSVWDLLKGFFNIVIGLHVAIFKTIVNILAALPAVWEATMGAIYNIVGSAIQKIVNTFVGGLGMIGDAIDALAGTNFGDGIRESLTMAFEGWDTSAAEATIAGAAGRISDAWGEAFSTDYIGNFGAAFQSNLQQVVAADKAAASSSDALANSFGQATNAMNQNGDAAKKNAQARSQFIKQLQQEYDQLLEANGRAEEVTRRWYAEQLQQLNALGLAHSRYAQMLDEVFGAKLIEARIKDVENTEAWAQGLIAAQRDVAGSIRDEWRTIQDAMGMSADGVEEWYTQQKRLLTAAGLDHTIFAQQLEDVYRNRIQKARVDDVTNAAAWLQGLNETQRGVVQGWADTYNGLRESSGGAVASLEEWHDEQKRILVAAGLEHSQWAQVVEDIYARRLPEARNQDIQSAYGWSSALTDAQRQVADDSALQHMRNLSLEVQATKEAMDAGVLTTLEYANRMRDLGLATMETQLQMGNASWADSMLISFGRVLEGFESIKASVTDLTTNALQTMVDGFANSIGRAIVYAEDLNTALYNVAREALAALISGLVKMAIQWALNAVIGQSIAAGVTAASAAQATALASAWAPAAAMASLATMGGNAAPAAAAIAGTTALAQMMAMAKGFSTGGPVSGAGTGTSDSIFARLSNGEFVINAKATRENFDLLNAINNGWSPQKMAFAKGGPVDLTAGGRVTPVVPLSKDSVHETNKERQARTSASSPQSAPTPVNVRVMNFTDPKEALATLDTADGEQVVLNMIERNGAQIRRLLGAN